MGKKYDIIWLESTDSTNSEAERRHDSIDNMSVIAAGFQTAGRGQRGSRWTSRPWENLTFSIAISFGDRFPGLPASEQFAISECAALAVADFLEENGIGARIKWPNDIYVNDSKICGILIEHRIRGAQVASSIIGIGLNMNQTEFPPEIPNPVSMKDITGMTYMPRQAVERLADIFLSLMEQTSTADGMESVRDRYLSRLYRKDELHGFTDCRTGRRFQGIIRGVGENACIRIEIPGEGISEFAFKEVSYVI